MPAKRRGAALRPLVAAASVLVGVTLAFGWWRSRPDGPAQGPRARRIVVAVFENQTGDPALDPLGRMASDWITQGLSRIAGLEVVPSTSVLYAQPSGGSERQGGDPIERLAKETTAGTVVSGAYYLQGDTLRFQARVTDAAHRRLIQALDPVSGVRGAPLEPIDALRQRVMGAVAATFEAVHEMGIQQRPPLYDAYREFIAGFELFQTDDAEALRHFERAVELDPEFLAPLFYEAYLRDQAGDHARVAAILRTLTARREQLPPFGRRWLDIMLAYASHRYEDALQHTRGALGIAPRDPMVTLWFGYMATLCNRPHEVLDAFDRFGPRPYPDHALGATWMINLCGALHVLGQHQRELNEAHRARVAHPDQSGLWTMEGDALAALGRSAPLDRLLDERLAAVSTLGTPGDMMLEVAAELRAHGHHAASVSLGGRAVTWYRERLGQQPDSAQSLPGLVQALCRAERWDEAYVACRTLAGHEPGDPEYLGQLGCLAARLGRREEAVRIADGLGAMNGAYLFGTHTYRRACIAALLGEQRLAVDLLRRSFAEGRGIGRGPHRDMDLEPVWGYPPFRELMKPQD